jgi:hypothetical protein
MNRKATEEVFWDMMLWSWVIYDVAEDVVTSRVKM